MGFQQGLSGLNSSSKSLDAIGHNIANSNTTGFKSSRTEFADMVAHAIGSAGGTNDGIGVEVADVAQQFTQGSITSTGNNMDVAINGNGFFTLEQPDGTLAYTRAGNFKLDSSGNMVTNSGGQLMGYALDPTTGLRTSSELTALSFPTSAPIAAQATSTVTAELNLDARANLAAGDSTTTPVIAATPRATYGTSVNVYDSQGVATPLSLYFEKTADNTWTVYNSLDSTAASIGTLVFDANGALTSGNPLTNITIPVDNPNSPTPGSVTVSIDLTGSTQFGSNFAVSDISQNGYASGSMTGISIGDDGTISTRYSNGVTQTEGQIALANFRNSQGLTPVGENNWVETSDSGSPTMGTATTGSLGTLRSGALEDSNVDLTAELVNMMTAQRAYQANAQTIKTQDQVMSTLVNLR